MVRSLAEDAAKGYQRAQRLFAEILSTSENQSMRLHNKFLETAIEYKVGWGKEFKRCKHLELKPPQLIPHPDDIKIDFQTGLVQIKGPMDKDEKTGLDDLMARKDESLSSIEENKQLVCETQTSNTNKCSSTRSNM